VAPNDYRLRHPIAIQEPTNRSTSFVGNSRGGLSASQRSDVMGLAQTWLREGTGAINADVPTGTPKCARGGGYVPRESGDACRGGRNLRVELSCALSSRQSAPACDRSG